MSRKKIFWMAFLALVLVVPAAHAAGPGSWVVSVNGGLAMPMGDFSDEDLGNADPGFQFGGAVDYVINEMFAVGVDGSWSKNKHGGEGETFDIGGGFTAVYDKDEYTTWQVGAHGKYMIPAGGGPVSPFLLAGAGMYSTKEKWEGTISGGGSSISDDGEFDFDTNFGFRLGAGAGYKANEQVTVGVEGDYNFVTLDKDKVGSDSLQYLGIRAFLAWAFMPK